MSTTTLDRTGGGCVMNDQQRYVISHDAISPELTPPMTFEEVENYVQTWLNGRVMQPLSDDNDRQAWQRTMDTLRERTDGVYADVGCGLEMIAVPAP